MEGYGFFAKNLEYGQSKAVGAELGFIMTTKDMAEKKRPVRAHRVGLPEHPGRAAADPQQVRRRLRQADRARSPRCRPRPPRPSSSAPWSSPEQIKAQAKAFADLGVIQKDVSGDIAKYWDGSFVANAQQEMKPAADLLLDNRGRKDRAGPRCCRCWCVAALAGRRHRTARCSAACCRRRTGSGQAWKIWAFGPAGMGLNPYSGTWFDNALFSTERVAKGFGARHPGRRAARHRDRLVAAGGRHLRSDDPGAAADPDHRLAAVLDRGVRHPRHRRSVPDRARRVLPDRRSTPPRARATSTRNWIRAALMMGASADRRADPRGAAGRRCRRSSPDCGSASASAGPRSSCPKWSR